MKVSLFDNIKWEYYPKYDAYLGFDDNLPCNDFADVIYAKVEAGKTLAAHYHNRPHPDGYETFFFFNGGDITVLLDDGKTKDIKTDKPFHLTFFDKETHGIQNNSQGDLVFEVFLAPKHEDDEEVMS